MKRLTIPLVLLAMLQGCVIIPTLEHHTDEYGTRGIIDESTIAFMHTGATAREEVLLKLGEPEHVWDNGRKFAYTGRLPAATLYSVGLQRGSYEHRAELRPPHPVQSGRPSGQI